MRTRFSILSRRSIRDGHGKRRGGAPPWSEKAPRLRGRDQALLPPPPLLVHASDSGHPTSLPMRSTVAPDRQRGGHANATGLLRAEGVAVAPEERRLRERCEG